MIIEDKCGICGLEAIHNPVGAEYEYYCCNCFHTGESCPNDIDKDDDEQA